MRDKDIRYLLIRYIQNEISNDSSCIIVEELGLCTGATRVDIAIINGFIHGYEIKSDRDSLSRLPTQIDLYSRVLDYATLVVGHVHLKKARDMIPAWWGIYVVNEDTTGTQKINIKRKAKRNPGQNPYSIAQLLWASEAMLILDGHGLAKGLRKKPRQALWDALVNNFTLDELRWMVRQALKNRGDWRNPESTPSTTAISHGAQIISQF